MQWLNTLDRYKRVDCLAAQEAGVRARFSLTRTDTDSCAWAISADGARYSAASAVVAALATAVGAPWLLAVFAVPFVRTASNALYRRVAEHRHILPGTEPYCSRRACTEP